MPRRWAGKADAAGNNSERVELPSPGLAAQRTTLGTIPHARHEPCRCNDESQGGSGVMTPFFCRRSFCLIFPCPGAPATMADGHRVHKSVAWVLAHETEPGFPLPVEALQASCFARGSVPRVVRCAANPGLGSSTLSELFPLQVFIACGLSCL